jgi:hypothetical protein
MPTYDVLASFWRGWRSLTPQQQHAFLHVVEQFIADLRTGTFRPALRVKRIQGYPGVWELSWAPDGRATLSTVTRSVESRTSCGDGSGRTTSSVARDRACIATHLSRQPRRLVYPSGTRDVDGKARLRTSRVRNPLRTKRILRVELGGLEPPTSWVRSAHST